MLLGIVAGISEYLSERYSLETLLNPDRIKDGAFKTIAKNAIAEGKPLTRMRLKTQTTARIIKIREVCRNERQPNMRRAAGKS